MQANTSHRDRIDLLELVRMQLGQIRDNDMYQIAAVSLPRRLAGCMRKVDLGSGLDGCNEGIGFPIYAMACEIGAENKRDE